MNWPQWMLKHRTNTMFFQQKDVSVAIQMHINPLPFNTNTSLFTPLCRRQSVEVWDFTTQCNINTKQQRQKNTVSRVRIYECHDSYAQLKLLTSWAVVWFENIMMKLPTNRDSIESAYSPFSFKICVPNCRRSSHSIFGSLTAFWLNDGNSSGKRIGDRLTRSCWKSVSLYITFRRIRRLYACCKIIRFGMKGHSLFGNPDMHRFKTISQIHNK